MRVAVRLGLPMLGAHPEMSLALGRKSVARSIFQEAEVNPATPEKEKCESLR